MSPVSRTGKFVVARVGSHGDQRSGERSTNGPGIVGPTPEFRRTYPGLLPFFPLFALLSNMGSIELAGVVRDRDARRHARQRTFASGDGRPCLWSDAVARAHPPARFDRRRVWHSL